MGSFLWSKLWTGLVPVLLLAEALTVASNHLLGVPGSLKLLCAPAIAFMAAALVGLACGMGARHPRFGAENVTQVAGSYGGVAFMVLAVLYILVTVALLAWPASVCLWHEYRGLPIAPRRAGRGWPCAWRRQSPSMPLTFWSSMRSGVRALEELG